MRDGGRLEVRALAVGVEGTRLLTGIDFAVGPGERCALSGPSGIGKTTLLRTLAGLIDPLDGSVLLDGRAPAEHGWPSYRRRVLLVQQRPILGDRLVRDALARPFTYRTAGETPWPESSATELMARLGLPAARLDQAAGSLSEGEAQRVSLVRALTVEPDVLLADEPTSALDPAAREAVEQVLAEEAARRGLALVLVSHDPDQVARLGCRPIDLGPHAGGGRG